MAKATCSTRDCSSPTVARGWCQSCYNRAYRSGAFQYALPLADLHRVRNVDREAKTGDCSKCGPTRVRVRSDRKTVQCMSKRRNERDVDSALRPDEGFRRRLRDKYRMQISDWDALLIEQSGRCAICLCTLDFPHVDHDHGTGEVRGLLCKWCNLGIGYMRDDAARLRAAAEYLSR